MSEDISEVNDEEYEAENIDQNNLPVSTVLHGTESGKKSITMPKWVHECVRYAAEQRNRKMTQGILSYELLLFTHEELKDEIDSTEQAVNALLSSAGIDTQAVDNIRKMNRSEARAELMRDVTNPEAKRTQVRLWLPESTLSTSPWSRGWGSKIEDGLVTVYTSAYNDRFDRIKCKRQVLDYILDGIEPTHDVARAICLNDGADDFEDLPTIDSDGSIAASINSRSRLDAEMTEKEWYERDDLTRETLVERGDELYRWKNKFEALNTVFENLDEELQTKEDMELLVKEAFEPGDGWDTDGYAGKMVEKWVEKYNIRFNDEELSEEEVTERINKIITETDMPLNFEFIWKSDVYGGIEDEFMQRKILERCCHSTWKNGENVYVDLDIEQTLEKVGWTVPEGYSSTDVWVGRTFSNVFSVDPNNQTVQPKSSDYDLPE